MAELNPLGSFLSGMQASQQVRQLKQQRADEQLVRGLAPQVIAGDAQAFDQVAAVNPQAAQSYQQVGDGQVRRLQGAINFMTQAQQSGNPQAVEAAYQQVRPYLARFGQEPPATFAEAQPQFEQAKARIAMLGGAARPDVKVVGNALVDSNGNEVYRAREDARVVDINVPGGKQQVLYDPQTRQLANLDGTPYFQEPQLERQMVNGQPINLGTNLTPEERQLAMEDAASGGQMTNVTLSPRDVQQFTEAPTRIGFSPTAPAISPYQQEQLRLAREASDRANQAAQRADRGSAPAGFRWSADGTRLEPIPGAPQSTQTPKTTEGERNASGFYSRMSAAERTLDSIANAGYDPTNARDRAAASLANQGGVTGGLANSRITPEGQRYRQAAFDWVRAKLRKESGAAIGVDEARQEYENYFPVFGDSAAVIEQKRQARQAANEAMRSAAGSAAGNELRTTSNVVDGPRQSSPRAAPAVGTIQRGYRFLGGDPSNPASWERE